MSNKQIPSVRYSVCQIYACGTCSYPVCLSCLPGTQYIAAAFMYYVHYKEELSLIVLIRQDIFSEVIIVPHDNVCCAIYFELFKQII